MRQRRRLGVVLGIEGRRAPFERALSVRPDAARGGSAERGAFFYNYKIGALSIKRARARRRAVNYNNMRDSARGFSGALYYKTVALCGAKPFV